MTEKDRFIIEGGHPLGGHLRVQGAKNSVLPIMAAAVMCRGESRIDNVPDLSDVRTAISILRHLGAKVRREGASLYVDASSLTAHDIPDGLMRRMRSSVFFLGAILAACGRCEMSYPGGCELGPRPIDLHIDALRELGISISEEGGRLTARVEHPRAGDVHLAFPSVGATENAMLAACAIPGTTRIRNAAREPEIRNLQEFLNAAGACILGAGSETIEIRGGRPLHPAHIRIMPDRIVAATWLCAAAAAGGDLFLDEAEEETVATVCRSLRRAGVRIDRERGGLRVRSTGRLRGGEVIRTQPYPGFPTDAQAILMATLAKSEGVSIFVENIFDSRFRHVSELVRMGANIRTEGRTAVVCGVPRLCGCEVCACDLRAGAALCVACLAAEGESTLFHVSHIDRGYENVIQLLNQAGASIRRVAGEEEGGKSGM
ncbi:MAG: UDP-N-acetylglucosamine 1-carboxyvinyltransferase [Clostridia bacterium]|nr:UDP-N-acetylglucosamine 1-carboxyvinyltransferase [Clostridia bacterium]